MKWSFLALALPLAGCLGSPRVGEAIPGGGGGTAQSFTSISQTILTPRCATSACHSGNPPANNVPVSLDEDRAYQELVGVPSTQLPSMDLVKPGEPAASYLVAKLRGTHLLDGGSGDRMPINAEALGEDELQAIEAWISNGAPND